jgi:hypothetical protein
MKSLVNQRRQGAWPRTALVMWTLAVSAMARAQQPQVVQTRSMGQVMTIRGTLELSRSDFEEGGFTVQTVLNDKVIYTERENVSLGIDTSYPKEGPARLILLEVPSGGTACPSFYRVLEIKDDGSTVRSKTFGNCGNNARSSFTQGVLRIDFPKAGRAAPESWTYQNGTLSKVTPRGK